MYSYLLLQVSLFLALSHATCNLLSSDKTSYIDTESDTSILTMCDEDESSLSLWEQYHCEFIANRDGHQKCWPQRRMSTCGPGDLKGAIFLYHGYSACPDQYNVLAPKLQDECYHVYQILTLGHGYTPCNDAECIVERWNLTAMPIQRQPYIDYIRDMIVTIEAEVSIIKECEVSANSAYNSDNFEVVVGGLSFGAPLAAATVAFSGSTSVFTKQILMSPFFGVSSSAADNVGYKCALNDAAFEDCLSLYFKEMEFEIDDATSEDLTGMVTAALSSFVDVEFLDASFETLNVLLRKILVWVVENADAIDDETVKQKINEVLVGIIPWGEQCWKDVDDRDRGGFCDFEAHHLFAAHSFANYLVDSLYYNERDLTIQTLTILVERDGPTRNSLITDYLNRFYNHNDDVISSVDACEWLIALECQESSYQGAIDNTCGVPHSSMAEADNLGIPPGTMYWAEWYHNGMIAFINGDTFDDTHFMVTEQWDTTSEQCISIDLSDPPKALIADVPSVLTIVVGVTQEQLTSKAKVSILNGLSELLEVDRGVLELTYTLIESLTNANAATDTDDVSEFYVEIDPYAARLVSALLDNNALRAIGNYSIVRAEIDGKEYDVDYDMTTAAPTDGSNGNMLMLWVVMDCVMLIFVV